MQETQVSNLESFTVGKYWGHADMDWDWVDSNGRSGGLVSVWDPKVFFKQSVIKHDSFLVVSGRLVGSDVRINVANIYASRDFSKRRALWEDLRRVKEGSNGVWIMVGDFNEVREEGDRMLSRFDSFGASLFNMFIAETGMFEYQMGGYKFTFMPEDGSSFVEVVNQVVSTHVSVGNKMKDLACLLKSLKVNIKDWRKLSKDLEEKELNVLKNEVDLIDRLAENRRLTLEEKERRTAGRWKIKKHEKKRIIDLKQLAKFRWAKVGDENSKFFHGLINSRKARNCITSLVIDGKIVSDPMVIKHEVKMRFMSRFTEPLQRRPSLDGRGCRRLSEVQVKSLVAVFLRKKLKMLYGRMGVIEPPGRTALLLSLLKDFGFCWKTFL
ncbi:uncharacterized protein LOC110882783 [Helianthus annuus]|uniref:uncharacterized protein LOC110882783 n=1 Tax=Helianthus annuus TaxID=4232 RepID=UPI000B8FA392|nr:uncharacterized protein LOC110882783 [Helianthus annuus]